jgi:uncharacterized protein
MHLSFDTFLIVLPFIFLAGLVDSIAGGGGLISLPAYLAAGVPTHLALGCNKFSSTFGTLSATIRYFKHGMIDIPVASAAAVLALLGSFLGTRAVLLVDPMFLNFVLIVLIPIIAVFTLIHKNLGKTDRSSTIPLTLRIALGSVAGLIIGFYDGFFGPGTGTFLILIFALLLKYNFTTANGNTKVINLASNIASLVTFLWYGKVILMLAAPAALFGIAGNLAGSKLVVKNGAKVIRPVFITALLLLLSKILYNILTGPG